MIEETHDRPCFIFQSPPAAVAAATTTAFDGLLDLLLALCVGNGASDPGVSVSSKTKEVSLRDCVE